MQILPEKKSTGWFVLAAVIFCALFGSLMMSRFMLDIPVNLNNFVGFALMSLVLAFVVGVGGYVGWNFFFTIATVAYGIGLVQLLYIAGARSSDGWSDLTSVISFFTLAIGGVALGLVIELIIHFALKNRKC